MEASANSLKAAVEELESAMVVGDLETQESLLKAMEAFNATLEANKKLANESDTSMKTELLAAIEATKKEASELITKQMEAVTKQLNDLVTNNKIEMNGELEQTVQMLTNSIEAAKQMALGSDVAMREELDAAINNSKIEATNAINAAIEAAMQEFDSKIASGGQATLDQLKVSMDKVDAAIKAAEKLAADNDVVVKEALEKKIADVKAELAADSDKALKALETKLMAEINKASTGSSAEVSKLVGDFEAALTELRPKVLPGGHGNSGDKNHPPNRCACPHQGISISAYRNSHDHFRQRNYKLRYKNPIPLSGKEIPNHNVPCGKSNPPRYRGCVGQRGCGHVEQLLRLHHPKQPWQAHQQRIHRHDC